MVLFEFRFKMQLFGECFNFCESVGILFEKGLFLKKDLLSKLQVEKYSENIKMPLIDHIVSHSFVSSYFTDDSKAVAHFLTLHDS